MIPTIGRIVHYTLTSEDASQINRRRTTAAHIKDRMQPMASPAWPEGAQAHIGNDAAEGQIYPMIITRVWGKDESSSVNGQVFLDGNDVLWKTSVQVDNGPGTFTWPVKG